MTAGSARQGCYAFTGGLPRPNAALTDSPSPIWSNEIDLSHWLFGSAAATVYAVGRRLGSPESGRPDFVQLHLGFQDGGMAVIGYAATLPAGDGYTSVSMVGSTGGVHGDDAHNVNLVYRGGPPSAMRTGYGHGHVLALLQEFVDSISEGREPDNRGSDALAAIQVAEAAQQSMASGRARHALREVDMSQSDNFRFAALSAVKHEYLPLGVAQHPRFDPVVVADDPDQPEWVHERNEILAGQLGVPYVRDVDRALTEYGADVVVVSSQAERHCDLSVRAADAGLHVVQDKPMSTKVSECDRVVEAVERNNVKFMMWNRNGWRTVRQAADAINRGDIGVPYSVHVDFYFASDAGPPKGSRKPGDPAIDWEEYQKSAHATGRDGGVGMLRPWASSRSKASTRWPTSGC